MSRMRAFTLSATLSALTLIFAFQGFAPPEDDHGHGTQEAVVAMAAGSGADEGVWYREGDECQYICQYFPCCDVELSAETTGFALNAWGDCEGA